MSKYDDIIAVESEISGYRRTCLQTAVYFDKKMVAWKDSLQWNNNFLRSLSDKHIFRLRKLLEKTEILTWQRRYEGDKGRLNDICPTRPEEWRVKVTFSDDTVFVSDGCCQHPDQWQDFRAFVEDASRTPFRLR